jgi:hypothetical protein
MRWAHSPFGGQKVVKDTLRDKLCKLRHVRTINAFGRIRSPELKRFMVKCTNLRKLRNFWTYEYIHPGSEEVAECGKEVLRKR